VGRLAPAAQPEPRPYLELVGVTKRFGATVAVDAVDFAVATGTVHAIVGENGAGKSTLGKIVAGVLQPDSGSLQVCGQVVHFGSPRDALEHGITTIAQELSLVPARSVVENVYLGIEDSSLGIVNTRALRRRLDDLMEQSDIRVSPTRLVRELSPHDQQKVEILRALARDARFIVMDEPTARLSADETISLRRTVRALADAGRTIVFVSHFLEEVLEVSDVITIMRDGHVVRTSACAEETYDSCIEGMIGRTLESTFPPKRTLPADAATILTVDGLTRDGVFEDVSFEVRAGEIVVLAGLVGSGRSEVVRAIFGADPISRGRVELEGQPVEFGSPGQAIAHGVAMIPESRKEQGLVLGRSVRENVSLPHLRRFSRAGVMAPRAERRSVDEMMERAGVRGIGMDARARNASGGNQQKMLFARWLLAEPPLLIADEPTRGVDVGSKRNIYDLLAELAGEGMAILVVSSETEEVLGLADRIVVMRDGRVLDELDGHSATEEELVALAFGTEQAVAQG
jgi:simple sugar transport system ATP-binding protein/ribose transport system ATP-binding protein